MKRMTVTLTDEMAVALDRTAKRLGRSKSELIRDGVRRVLESRQARHPRFPLFASDDPMLAERVDELLEGFGS